MSRRFPAGASPPSVCLRAMGLALLLIGGDAWANPPVAGDHIEPFALADQFGELRQVDASLGALLCTSDMDGGKLIEAALKLNGSRLLEDANAAFVANISRMPKIITRVFAMRSFRKRGYPMLLDMEGATKGALPSQKGKATLLELDHLRILSVRHFHDAKSLRKALVELGERIPAQ